MCGKWLGQFSDGFYWSTDAKSWTAAANAPSMFTRFCYGKGRYIAWCGNSSDRGIYYSSDASTWIKGSITVSTTTTIINIFFDEARDVFVAVEGYGIQYSVDGATWTKSNYPSKNSYIAVSEERIVAGYAGIYYSDDFKIWTKANMGDIGVGNIKYAGGKFIAILRYPNSTTKKVLIRSIGGITWEYINAPRFYNNGFNSLSYCKTTWFAHGIANILYRSRG